ncbi:MAG: hypothetical protein E3J72_19340 [Planctomycetota bacterium]|nr:MAG: hypothetical protein E3J72_19340 [Planctomycetota bacterium]
MPESLKKKINEIFQHDATKPLEPHDFNLRDQTIMALDLIASAVDDLREKVTKLEKQGPLNPGLKRM